MLAESIPLLLCFNHGLKRCLWAGKTGRAIYYRDSRLSGRSADRRLVKQFIAKTAVPEYSRLRGTKKTHWPELRLASGRPRVDGPIKEIYRYQWAVYWVSSNKRHWGMKFYSADIQMLNSGWNTLYLTLVFLNWHRASFHLFRITINVVDRTMQHMNNDPAQEGRNNWIQQLLDGISDTKIPSNYGSMYVFMIESSPQLYFQRILVQKWTDRVCRLKLAVTCLFACRTWVMV
jgi:hypothetical protein